MFDLSVTLRAFARRNRFAACRVDGLQRRGAVPRANLDYRSPETSDRASGFIARTAGRRAAQRASCRADAPDEINRRAPKRWSMRICLETFFLYMSRVT